MVASRRRKLADRMGHEKDEHGHRLKVSYVAGYHETSRKEVIVDRCALLLAHCTVSEVTMMCLYGYYRPGPESMMNFC